MQASTADKIASIQAVVFHPAAASDDPAAYWTQRREFVATLPHLRDFRRAAEQVLPPSVVADRGHFVKVAEDRAFCHGRR